MGRSLAHLTTRDIGEIHEKHLRTVDANKLRKAGVGSVADLLLHAPRRYLDRSQIFDIGAVPIGEEVTIGGTVTSVESRNLPRKGPRGKPRKMTTATIVDANGHALTAVWFNPYLKGVVEGRALVLSGKVELYRGVRQMSSPDKEDFDESGESLVTGRVVPVHPEVAGVAASAIRRAIASAVRRSWPVEEVVPASIRQRLRLVDRATAIRDLHFPETLADVYPARRRLIFDELFRIEIGLAIRRHNQVRTATGIAHDPGGELVGRFVAALPYPLTAAQRRSIGEVQADMAAPHPMHRLLQGEVGSGKTVVAFATLLTAVQSGYQGAVMAPTEVLAEQHYRGFAALVGEAGLAPGHVDIAAAEGQDSLFAGGGPEEAPVVRLALLTGNSAITNFAPGAGRRDVEKLIGSGVVDIVIGTHALIQVGLHFAALGVAVVDEQHRFGVAQRVKLREKATDGEPDLLVMTATPIPRSLAMTLYGDLEVSLLDEMPPGRSPVRTHHVTWSGADMDRVYGLIRREVAEGRQAFVVCPLVDDSEKLEATSATAEYERLSGILGDLRVGLLHGQLRPDDKEAVMSAFRRGEVDVLVATTVIEVGVDVPNATVMVIEDADRFGLSQLHQLRGRVGRGEHPATCVLVAEPATDEGQERIAAMVATTDGFVLAEEDLRIRGQGTVFRERQAGGSDLRLADILRDADLLAEARREAFALVDADPDLERHPELREEIMEVLGPDAVEWLFEKWG